MVRQAQSVVPGRGRYNAALLLRRRKQCEGIPRAPLFEAASALEIFQLAENLHPGDFRKWYRRRTRRFNDVTANALRGRFDILELHAAFILIAGGNYQRARIKRNGPPTEW